MKRRLLVLITLVAIGTLGADIARSADPEEQPDRKSIGYATVAEAYAALIAKPGVTISVEGGKTIIKDLNGPNPAGWIFYPKGHPAYPTVIKRYIENTPHGAFMMTHVLCEAAQDVCDKYFAQK